MNDLPVPVIGQPLDRADGRLKVTGAARYSAEWPVEKVSHGVLVRSSVARGRIVSLRTREAETVPGVLAVFSHLNPPPLPDTSAFSTNEEERGSMSMSVRPLSSSEIVYNGQYIALVVAGTLEQARHAARLVRAEYDTTAADRPRVTLARELAHGEYPEKIRDDPPERKHGDPEPALAGAPVKFDAQYTTPWETHNPMEPHATLALWEGEKLTVYDATQNVTGLRKMLAATFGIPLENVRVISKFVGGAFGSKGLAWPHVPLAVAAARALQRPVKLALHRHDMFTNVGYRSPTLQRVQLGASATGELISVIHSGYSQSTQRDTFIEPFTDPTANMYATPHLLLTQKHVKLNVCRPTFMRAPGEVTGMFALECALDELAWQLQLDPVELRLRNDAAVSPLKQYPYSSRALRECLALGAEKFRWEDRPRALRTELKGGGGLLRGCGMAGSTYPVNRSGAKARLVLRTDGTVLAQSATHDLGTGTYTVLAQFLAELLGIPAERVRFDLGDSLFPDSPVAGGSQSVSSVGSALQAAVEAAAAELLKVASADPQTPLRDASPTGVVLHHGRLHVKGDEARGEDLTAILARAGRDSLEVTGTARPQDEKKKFAMHAFGAHFCEVHVDPHLGTIRVARWVSAHACGRVLNEKTARSQIHGGIIMGLGMALMEETVLDERSGRVVTDDLADYHVPVHADIPDIESYFVPEVDNIGSPIGTKGIGEIGIVGAAAAIANAVYHATGRRLRDLPLTPDKLIAG